MGYYDECYPTPEEICEQCKHHNIEKTDDLRIFIDTPVSSRLQRKFVCATCGEEIWNDIPVVFKKSFFEEAQKMPEQTAVINNENALS
jgi:hypothetical protein